ncbi:helicase-related protein [Vibrio tapetis]|uniref:Putative HrpA-like helicase n=1 Tax=Vibrio tapetis subsp. tapetis TaxID=1671868 RepID=A0A2N8Z930_9VIBR|nr:helicase-related protein [Vibrio tapetis]SON48406.1 putative HrpA-like helicase [Vibrio tapetis subsp. tapetis]
MQPTTSLPIDASRQEFDRLVSQHHLVVEAETGSGKSTRLPLWSAKFGRVLVIEPRRIACTSLAEFLAKSEGSVLGERIGYAIKLDAHYNDNTQVVFVTPGVALRWYSENRLVDFDIVMVDEYHERRWDTDLLTALLKQHNRHRIILTSATIESQRLAQYIDAQSLRAEGRTFGVEIHYNARDAHRLPDARDIEKRVFDQIVELLPTTDGDMLVFLPGRKEIQQCVSLLNRIESLIVVPLHASVTDEQRRIAMNQQPGQKVVVATNVAETSLTIPNISVVVDSGLERRTLQRNGRTVLSLKSISQASAKQRAGRAGRVREGKCIRLFGANAPLELMTPPELQREELTEPMLASACCGENIEALTFLDSLPDKSLISAKNQLLTMRAIDEAGCITEHGKRLYPLPIDALYADLLTRLPTRALQEAMVDLSAALSVPARLYKLPNSVDDRDDIDQWERQHCDAMTLIKLVRGDVPECLNIEPLALTEAQQLAQQMREALDLPELSVASRCHRQQLAREIASLHPELVFVRREKRRQALGNGFSEVSVGKDSRFSDKAEAAIVLDQHSLPGRGVKQTLNLATVMMPISLDDLVALDMGEWQQTGTHVENKQVMSSMARVYAGRVIERKHTPATGTQAIIQALMSGKLWPGFAKSRQRDIQVWQLYVDLGLADEAPKKEQNRQSQTNFEKWMAQQLNELGISEMDELVLFEPDDFGFEGIPYWQREEFDGLYPSELQLSDIKLTVDYFPNKKLVHVIRHSGLRKGDPKRWELPTWNGWRIQYKKASRLIDIK